MSKSDKLAILGDLFTHMRPQYMIRRNLSWPSFVSQNEKIAGKLGALFSSQDHVKNFDFFVQELKLSKLATEAQLKELSKIKDAAVEENKNIASLNQKIEIFKSKMSQEKKDQLKSGKLTLAALLKEFSQNGDLNAAQQELLKPSLENAIQIQATEQQQLVDAQKNLTTKLQANRAKTLQSVEIDATPSYDVAKLHPMTKVYLDLVENPIDFKDPQLREFASQKIPHKLFADDARIQFLESKLVDLENQNRKPFMGSASYNVLPTGFTMQEPDFEWAKQRTHASNHQMIDMSKTEYEYNKETLRLAEAKLKENSKTQLKQFVLASDKKFFEMDFFAEECAREKRRILREIKTLIHAMKHTKYLTAEQVLDSFPDGKDIEAEIEKKLDDNDFELPEMDMEALWTKISGGKNFTDILVEKEKAVAEFQHSQEKQEPTYSATVNQIADFLKQKQVDFKAKH